MNFLIPELLVLHISPGLDHAIFNRDAAVGIIVVDLHDWIVRRFWKCPDVYRPLCGVITIGAVFLQSGNRLVRFFRRHDTAHRQGLAINA